MTDSKHTPGPWAVVDDYGMAFEIESRTSGVARVSTADVRAEANARLIAAAPDMLEALQLVEDNFLPFLIQNEYTPEWFVAVCKALNKAHGRIN
jgi:hypothetical protein